MSGPEHGHQSVTPHPTPGPAWPCVLSLALDGISSCRRYKTCTLEHEIYILIRTSYLMYNCLQPPSISLFLLGL